VQQRGCLPLVSFSLLPTKNIPAWTRTTSFTQVKLLLFPFSSSKISRKAKTRIDSRDLFKQSTASHRRLVCISQPSILLLHPSRFVYLAIAAHPCCARSSSFSDHSAFGASRFDWRLAQPALPLCNLQNITKLIICSLHVLNSHSVSRWTVPKFNRSSGLEKGQRKEGVQFVIPSHPTTPHCRKVRVQPQTFTGSAQHGQASRLP
jgi:hypothetical protein